MQPNEIGNFKHMSARGETGAEPRTSNDYSNPIFQTTKIHYWGVVGKNGIYFIGNVFSDSLSSTGKIW